MNWIQVAGGISLIVLFLVLPKSKSNPRLLWPIIFLLTAASFCPVLFGGLLCFPRAISYGSNHHRCRTDSDSTAMHRPHKLLSELLRRGHISLAQHLFDSIPVKDVVAWSILIHGYARNGYFLQSLKAFSGMRMHRVLPNSFALVGVLVGVASSGHLLLSRCLHGLIVKYGQLASVIVGTALLNAYARCRDCRSSYRAFRELKNLGLISCNAMISAFVLNDHLEDAFALFNQFRKSGLAPGVTTIVSLVGACSNLRERKLCESVHGLSIKVSLLSDASVINSLLSAYSSFWDVNRARRLFEKMECKDVISWSTMMSLYIRFGDALEVLKLFNELRREDVCFDDGVIINLISACALLADFSKGRQAHAQVIISGYYSDVPVMNSIISMYSRCRQLDYSRGVFDRIAEKSVVSWSAIISGCAQNGRPKEAVNLWMKARLEVGASLDSVALKGVLAASAKLGALELCQQLHGHTFRAGYSCCTAVLNGLISAYSKCGSMELSLVVFREMISPRDVVSWNAVLSGYAINGYGDEAIRLYEEMREHGVKPDSATYLIVLNACSHAGLVECGLMTFRQMMDENGITPNEQHYGCLVDLLARAGRLRDASGFAHKYCGTASPEMWKALLGGCIAHGDVELAKVASAKLVELGREGSDNVVLLSNAYASHGRFQEAQTLRWTGDEKGLRKDPAISLVLVGAGGLGY